jgi:molybdenum-dependent DNA-binding transcriptional regulator ModE
MSRHECSELDDADLETVSGGKELRGELSSAIQRANSAFGSLDRAARDVGASSRSVAGQADKLAKSFGVN